MSVNITELNAALGAYVREHREELLISLLTDLNIEDRMEIWDDVKDEIAMPFLTLGNLVKPANPRKFEAAANGINFAARIGKVRPWQVDLTIIPLELEKSWLGHFRQKGSAYYQMPFEQFILEHIKAKIKEEIRLQGLFHGEYDAEGTSATDVMDGLLTLIATELAKEGTPLVPVVTGAITPQNVITAIESVYDALGEPYKNVPTQILVAPNVYTMFTRAARAAYGQNQNYKGIETLEMPLDGTLAVVKSEPGMAGSQRIIATTKDNIVYLTDSLDDANNINIETEKRAINIMVDGKAGIQLKQIHNKAVAVNNQA